MKIINKNQLTFDQRQQLESVIARKNRIESGDYWKGDKEPGRLYQDVLFLLSLIKC